MHDELAHTNSLQRTALYYVDRRNLLSLFGCLLPGLLAAPGHAALPSVLPSVNSSPQTAGDAQLLESTNNAQGLGTSDGIASGRGPYAVEALPPQSVSLSVDGSASPVQLRLCITLPMPLAPGPAASRSQALPSTLPTGMPARQQRLPLATFSPGFLVAPEAYQSYANALASTGFAVVAYEQIGESAVNGVDDHQAARLLSQIIGWAAQNVHPDR